MTRAFFDLMLVRLLQSHCNRERATAHLEKLLARAGAERVVRSEVLTPVRRRPKRLSPAINAGIIADYRAGMRATEIARTYRINEWTVHHRLKLAGITKRPSSMNEERIALAKSLRADGLSYDRIAARVGFSASTIRNVLNHRL